jgi:hypothetical protein
MLAAEERPSSTVARTAKLRIAAVLGMGVLAVAIAALWFATAALLIRVDFEDFPGGKFSVSGADYSVPAGTRTRWFLVFVDRDSEYRVTCPSSSDGEGYVTGHLNMFAHLKVERCKITALETY